MTMTSDLCVEVGGEDKHFPVRKDHIISAFVQIQI